MMKPMSPTTTLRSSCPAKLFPGLWGYGRGEFILPLLLLLLLLLW